MYSDSRISLRDAEGDVLQVPDDVWDAERNYTLTHPEVRQVGNDLAVPSTACIKIKAIYDRNWVQSSGGDGPMALIKLYAVLNEAQNIYRTKYGSSNQLGSSFTFNYEGKFFINSISDVPYLLYT
jgi:hypothetical protein